MENKFAQKNRIGLFYVPLAAYFLLFRAAFTLDIIYYSASYFSFASLQIKYLSFIIALLCDAV